MISTKEERRYEAIRQAVRDKRLHPGKQMPNGGIVIAQTLVAEHEWANDYIVLAIVENQFQAFATWRRVIGVEQKADGGYGPLQYCWSGHYFRNIENALDDYHQRVAENGGGLDESAPSDRGRTKVDQV